MIKLGFIGLGGMGRFQLNAFAGIRGCRIVAGSDLVVPARADFTASHPAARVFEDYEKLLADPGVDAVVVAVPTLHHKQVAVDALAHRKPVLVEKPLARTVADGRKMIEAAGKHRTLLMVAHCRRYDPVWGAWAKVVQCGRLGQPVLWRHAMAGLGPANPWFMDARVGGGPLIDGAVHNYDFANMLWGDPQSVVASTLKFNPRVTATDTGSAVVRYQSGNQLLVSWSWASRGAGLFDVIGPKGSIQSGSGSLKLPPGSDNERTLFCHTDLGGKARLIQVRQGFATMYRNQARHFLDCIRGAVSCRTPATEAIKAVAVAEAILKAGPQGRAGKVAW